MKKISVILLVLLLNGCAGVHAWIVAHEVAIADTGIIASTAAATEAAVGNGVTLFRDAKGK